MHAEARLMSLPWQDLLWLLLPLAVVSGWVAARLDRKSRSGSGNRQYTSGYFRGINFVLNEQPDKAIEVFTRLLEVNSETVETHLALGSLFRRRGEVERAIRIHQNLIARPTLDTEQRALALYELAMDYHKAGLLDRAENLFLELTEIPVHIEQALRMLLTIYEHEREWEKAIATARRLAPLNNQGLALRLAQYHCELAEQSVHDSDQSRAGKILKEALKIDSGCARASLLLGQIDADAGRWPQALESWKRIEQQDSQLLDEVIDSIATAYRKIGKEQDFLSYLERRMKNNPGPRTIDRMVSTILDQRGIDEAHRYILEHLRQQPTLVGLRNLVDLQLDHNKSGSQESLPLLKSTLERLASNQQGYLCRQCGFRGLSLHWQCPACHQWVTMQRSSCLIEPSTSISVDSALGKIKPNTNVLRG